MNQTSELSFVLRKWIVVQKQSKKFKCIQEKERWFSSLHWNIHLHKEIKKEMRREFCILFFTEEDAIKKGIWAEIHLL